MSEPKSIKQIMIEMAANAAEPMGKLLRSCPFIQAELIKQGKIYKEGSKEELLNDTNLSFVFDLPLCVKSSKGRYFVQSIGD